MDVRVGYLGIGSYVPETELTNADLERIVDTDDAWIRRRTGVVSRRVLNGRESILDMAVKAASAAIADAGLVPEDIDEIRVAAVSWLRLPSLATELQRELGVGEASALDVAAGCAGFIYAVQDAWNRILVERVRGGRRLRVLVLGVDALSHITDYTDRGTAVLFGDGAGAVVMGEVEAGGLLAVHTQADGRYGHLLYTEPPNGHPTQGKGSPIVEAHRPQQVLRMDGPRVFAAAVESMARDVHRVLEKYRAETGRTVSIADVDYVYPHQANLRIIERVAQRLGVPMERVYTDGIARLGNTSSASIPLGYADARSHRPSGPGPWLEIDVAFGSGFSSGAILRQRIAAATPATPPARRAQSPDQTK